MADSVEPCIGNHVCCNRPVFDRTLYPCGLGNQRDAAVAKVRELTAENAELRRKAAAFDWLGSNEDYAPVPLKGGGWAIGCYSQPFATPIEAVEFVMKQEAANAAKR